MLLALSIKIDVQVADTNLIYLTIYYLIPFSKKLVKYSCNRNKNGTAVAIPRMSLVWSMKLIQQELNVKIYCFSVYVLILFQENLT